MELDIIKTQTTWNDASASINDNFEKLRLAAEQGGGTVEVDSAMSDTSENAVANKVIKKYIDDANVYLEGYAEEVANDALTAAKAYAAPFYINVGMEFPLNEDTHGTLDIATIGVDYTSVVAAYEEGRDIVLNESNGRRHICTDFFPNQVEGIVTFTLRAYSYMSGVLRTMLLMFSEGGTGVFWNTKCTPVQEELVSGENIATINGFSLLQGANIVIQTEQIEVDDALDAQSENPVQNKVVKAAIDAKQDLLVSGTNIKTINGGSILGSGNIEVSVEVVDSLDSESTTSALSANQGRVLKNIIDSSPGINQKVYIVYVDETLEDWQKAANAEAVAAVNANEKAIYLINSADTGITVTALGAAPASGYAYFILVLAQSSSDGVTITTGSFTVGPDGIPFEQHTEDLLLRNTQIMELLAAKQETLVSGTNIKTINNESILGEGNITIEGGGSVEADTEMSDTSMNPVQNKVIKAYVDGLVGDINTVLDTINGEEI